MKITNLSLVYGKLNSLLIINNGGECLFHCDRDSFTAWDNWCEDISLHRTAKR